MISRNGICYDLEISPYKVIIDNIVYVFSSKYHAEKFKKKLNENREIINSSLEKRFNYKINVSTLADIVLYRKIETRGFLIINKGEKICQNSIIYVGGEVTTQN